MDRARLLFDVCLSKELPPAVDVAALLAWMRSPGAQIWANLRSGPKTGGEEKVQAENEKPEESRDTATLKVTFSASVAEKPGDQLRLAAAACLDQLRLVGAVSRGLQLDAREVRDSLRVGRHARIAEMARIVAGGDPSARLDAL